MDEDIVEQTLDLYIFDGDKALIGETFRSYLTIQDIERILE